MILEFLLGSLKVLCAVVAGVVAWICWNGVWDMAGERVWRSAWVLLLLACLFSIISGALVLGVLA